MWDEQELKVGVLQEFADAQRKGKQAQRYLMRWNWFMRKTPPWRRRQYAIEKANNTAWYAAELARARPNARQYYRANREQIRAKCAEDRARDRAARVSGRACPECGAPVGARKGIGPTPKFCSDRCNRRVASRNWWRRNRARKAGGS